MPPGNAEAMLHYRETIEVRVPQARIAPHVSKDELREIRELFRNRNIPIWGSRDTERNRRSFESMRPGDDLLIVEGPLIRFLGKVGYKLVRPELSRELWQNLGSGSAEPWSLIYFIANPQEVNVPFSKLAALLGYQPSFQLRGLTMVSSDRLTHFYGRYGDLYSVLERLKSGRDLEVRSGMGDQGVLQYPDQLVALQSEDVEKVLDSESVTDHVRVQWQLLNLGIKAGSRVWIPPGDQQRLRRTYQDLEIESAFASGIDLPHSYVENIDVVWKQQFRIDAAFEVENSTAIYSGLLRFADLSIVAPNTIYPMFIVAPEERRNRVRAQLRRPAFERLGMKERVRFLPYEAVSEIETFFREPGSRLTPEIMVGKSEVLS
jgi:hypothetical protein